MSRNMYFAQKGVRKEGRFWRKEPFIIVLLQMSFYKLDKIRFHDSNVNILCTRMLTLRAYEWIMCARKF